MRSFFNMLILGFSLMLLASCGSKNNASSPDSANDQVEQDSIKKIEIDTLISQINRKIREKRMLVSRIPNPKYNTTDSILYWFLPEKDARISNAMHPDSNVIWPNFWVYNGDLIMVRYRELDISGGKHVASETMIYLDHGDIVFCEERMKSLEEDEVPGVVRRLPYFKSTRTHKELHDLYEVYWKETLDEFKKQNVLPDWLKF